MDALTAWVLIVGLGATSLLTRGSFILFLGRLEVPKAAQRALRFVPAAVFTAVVVPELAFVAGSLRLGLDNPKLLAALVAAPVAWRTRSTTATILVGMAALLLAERYLVSS
jgi:branched-subunit amino acid transport protein